MKKFFQSDFTLSKRYLGILILLFSGLLVLAIFVVDTAGSSDNGFGPAQKYGLLLAFLIFLIGLSLLPLGDTPA